MLMIRKVRDRQLADGIRRQRDFYAQPRTSADIRGVQLDSLNEIWKHIGSAVPYYSELVRRGTAPGRFASLEEFRSTVPITARTTVRSHADRMTDSSMPVDFIRTTGGSTGEPVRIGGSNSELRVSNCNVWHGRGWFGVLPSDKLFMIWGHSHLLGRGIRGWINGQKREMKDRVLGYCRHSAYDLSDTALRQAGEKLLRQRPAWVYAYSVALDRFAEVNRARRDDFHVLKLKVAIATTEAFPSPQCAARIADVLGCPVTMEYGSVETGVMAQQQSGGPYFFFWHAHLLEGIASDHLPGCYELLVTSLYPRRFPLIRYRIGDLISENPDSPEFQQRFASVIGRRDDYIVLPDGKQIHCAAFTAAVRDIAAVGQFQFVQARDGTLALRYLSDQSLSVDTETEIVRKLSVIDPQLGSIRLERASKLAQAISGKSRAVVREESA